MRKVPYFSFYFRPRVFQPDLKWCHFHSLLHPWTCSSNPTQGSGSLKRYK